MYACRGPRYGHLTFKIVEPMNYAWLRARKLLPLLLMADLLIQAMKTVHEKHHRQHGSLLLTGFVKERMEKKREHSQHITTTPASKAIALVFPQEGASLIVNWSERKCTCLLYQDCGFPCWHGYALACDVNLDSI